MALQQLLHRHQQAVQVDRLALRPPYQGEQLGREVGAVARQHLHLRLCPRLSVLVLGGVVRGGYEVSVQCIRLIGCT